MNSSGSSSRDVSDAQVASDVAQLASLATTLDELTRQVGDIAVRYQGTAREDLAHGLFEVERSLLNAGRRLDRTRRS